MARITVDPITRIEGHLRVDVEVNGGKITNAWSSAQMFRGLETIMQGRDPRDAWLFAQRFCGVCTTTHAIASVRAVEDALNMEIPLNAQYIRNMITAVHCVQDHIVHFYHLSALDWVDIVSALNADPAKAEKIAESYSTWAGNDRFAFAAAKDRLADFVKRGKLGIFGTGYWGHPAMKLPPEVNLIAFTHYLKALDYQRMASQYVAVLGGKDPHLQNMLPGGVATAINLNNTATLNMERIALLQTLTRELNTFVNEVYLPDVIAIASFYPEWFSYGAGHKNYLAIPEFPLDSANTKFSDIGGIITNGDLTNFREIKSWKDEELRAGVTESTAGAWYGNSKSSLHPYVGESTPKYSDFDPDGAYSWCKAPRFNGKPYEVGPLAQILCAYAAGDKKVTSRVNAALSKANAMAGAKLDANALFSTLGRHLARAIRATIMIDNAQQNLDLFVANLASGDDKYATPITEFPAGEQRGVGFLEAPRGMLSHWLVINNGKIGRYQGVVPSTWNASPKDENGVKGPYEVSLMGNPVAIDNQPLEIIRTIHSFDPCIACAVHTVDPEGKEIVKVTVE